MNGIRCFALPVLISLIGISGPAPDQGENTGASLAVLTFQDETGDNASAEIRRDLSRYVQQTISKRYPDLHSRILDESRAGPDARDLQIENLVSLGRTLNVNFILRIALEEIQSESAGEYTISLVRLRADLISVSDGAVTSLTAEARARQRGEDSDPASRLPSVHTLQELGTSSLGTALRTSIVQLVPQVYEAIGVLPQAADMTSPGGTEEPVGDEPDEDTTASEEDAQAAQSDEELQQLVAEAEEALSNGSRSSLAHIQALRTALEALEATLQKKSATLEEGGEGDELDEDIEARKEDVGAAIQDIEEDPNYGDDAPRDAVSPERRSVLDSISDFLGKTLSIIQSVQEFRSSFRLAAQESVSSISGSELAPADTGEPAEEALEEINGVVTENGTPVAGADVTEADSGVSATTGSDGSYALQGVPSKLANLVVRNFGREVARGKLDVVRGLPRIADFDLGRTSLEAGKLRTVRIIPSSTVVPSTKRRTGPTGTLTGVVRDAQGRPAARALVLLKGLAMARTNSLGQYRIAKVPSGVHELVVRRLGFAPKTQQVRIQGTGSTESTTEFAAGDRLAKAKDTLLLRGATAGVGAALRGRIVDDRNRPVAGARVMVGGAAKAAVARTDADGRYSIRGIKPGTYRLLVSHLGHRPSNLSLTLRAGQAEEGNLQLRPTASRIEQRVSATVGARVAQIHGTVRESGGAPVLRAKVALRRPGKTKNKYSVYSDSRGDYAIKTVAGRYQVAVSKPGLGQMIRDVSLDAKANRREDFTLPGASHSGASRAASGRVVGLVTEKADGRPVAGAEVSLEGQAHVKDTTDGRGRYSLDKVPAGTQRLRVRKHAFADARASVVVKPGSVSQGNIVLEPERSSAGRGAALHASGVIRGRVVDARSRKPIAGAWVVVGDQRTESDRDGRYGFVNIPAGQHILRAGKSGFEDTKKTVSLDPRQSTTANVELNARSPGIRPGKIQRRP